MCQNKSQSAMEYLITYGWAILIIAVILGVLFTLGAFNGTGFAPKASTGSCYVYRPYGTGTTQFINLFGQCAGIPPRYVVDMANSVLSYVTVDHKFFNGNSFTILAWIRWPSGLNLTNYPPDYGYAWSGQSVTDGGFGILSRGGQWHLNFYNDDLTCSSGPVPGRWYLFGASWNSSTHNQTIWVNGAANCSRTSTGVLSTNDLLYIGSGVHTWDCECQARLDSSIADVQLYNSTLTANEVMFLYTEGIGGAPVAIQNIVGWWPLNGDTKDYSGNGYGGLADNISYNGTWLQSYFPT